MPNQTNKSLSKIYTLNSLPADSHVYNYRNFLSDMSDIRSHKSQLSLLWRYTTTLEGDLVSSLTWTNWYDPFLLPEDSWEADQSVGSVTIDETVLATDPTNKVQDALGNYYTFPAFTLTAANYLEILKSQDTNSPTVTFGAASRVTSEGLNNAVGQVFNSVQELAGRLTASETKAATDGINNLIDVIVTSAATGEVLQWNGSAWVDHLLVAADVSDFNSVADGRADGRITAANLAAASHTHTASGVTDFNATANALIAASSVNALSDVDTTSSAPNAGEALVWVSPNWVPGVISTTTTLDALTDTNLTSVVNKDLLYYNSGESKWKNAAIDNTYVNGLGTAAVKDTGTGVGDVILGSDSRLADDRTPVAHSAALITSGTLADARVVASNVTQHKASINLGDLGNVTVSGLISDKQLLLFDTATSTFVSGSLAAAEIPSLSTDKLTSGTLPVARGGTGVTSVPMIAVVTGADAAASRSTLGLGTAAVLAAGTSANNVVQLNGSSLLPAVDGSLLTDLAAGSITTGTVPVARGGTGSATAPMVGVITAADAAAARTAIGAGTVTVLDVGTNGGSAVQLTGHPGSTGSLPAVSGADLTALNASNVSSGTLAVAQGGTGVTSLPMVTIPGAADAAAARVVLGAQATLTAPVTSPAITGVSVGSITGVVKCSQAQYDAITPTSTVLYIII